MTDGKSKVVVRPKAFVAMMLHGTTHKNEVVHGILLGTSKGGILTITDAAAVSHGAPTLPLVETALGLVQAKSEDTIVGWYTAPLLLKDSRPGPVALRMVASLETDTNAPALLVLDNSALAACLNDTTVPESTIKAYGKDSLGKQWVDPLVLTLEDSQSGFRALKEAVAQNVGAEDLEDHLSGPASSPWYPNPSLANVLAKLGIK